MITILCVLVALCGCGSTRTRIPVEHVELVEFNTTHHYSDPMHQVIFWEWDQEYSRYNARGYVMMCDVMQTGTNRLRVYGDYSVLAGKVIFTETDNDPELDNRKLFEEKYRHKMPWGN